MKLCVLFLGHPVILYFIGGSWSVFVVTKSPTVVYKDAGKSPVLLDAWRAARNVHQHR